MLRPAAVALVAAVFSSCYRYVPADLDVTPPGTGARLVVTSAGSDQLLEVMPDHREGAPVRGEFAGVEADQVVLRVPVARRAVGMAQRVIEQRIVVPRAEVVSFERRELNKTGTAFLLAAAAGLTGAIVAVITEARNPEDSDPGEPPDESIIEIPLSSLLFGR